MVNPNSSEATVPVDGPARPAMLELAGFGLAFGDTPVLDKLHLCVPDEGVVALTGPQGGGKSSLLRTLAGLHGDRAEFRQWGEIRVGGEPLQAVRQPVLVRQQASALVGRVRDVFKRRAALEPADSATLLQTLERLGVAEGLQGGIDAPMLAQTAEVRRQVSVVAHLLDRPSLLLLDEPLAGLEESEVARFMTWLRRIRQEQPLLIATSDVELARHADQVIWFDAPSTAQLLAPGSPAIPPVSVPRRVAALPRRSRRGAEAASMVGRAMMSEARAPAGFHWIDPGKLAGCPTPGAEGPLKDDLERLQELGITYLITLTEEGLDRDVLEEFGLASFHLPVRDQQVPSIRQAYMLVHRMQRLLDQGHAVAVHCRSGLGRTATLFAAWLMREGGLSAQTAMARLRAIDKRHVQTAHQEAFLLAFEQDLQTRAAPAAPALLPNG